MKRVDDMSMEEMEGYFKRVDKLFHIFGSSYRIVWPFHVFSPFSPTRILLNLGVVISWINVIVWGATNRDSPDDLGRSLAGLWVVVLALCFVVGLLERHYRIKLRYHRLQKQRFVTRVAQPFMGRPRPVEDQPPKEAPAAPRMNGRPPHENPRENMDRSKDDTDLVETGMRLLRKIFR